MGVFHIKYETPTRISDDIKNTHTQHVIMSNETLVADTERHTLNSNFNKLDSASVFGRHARFTKQISSQIYLVRLSHLPNTLTLSSCLALSVESNAVQVQTLQN